MRFPGYAPATGVLVIRYYLPCRLSGCLLRTFAYSLCDPIKGAKGKIKQFVKALSRLSSYLFVCTWVLEILFSHGLNSMFGNWCFRLEIAFHDLHSMFDNTSDFHVFISLGLALAYLDSIFPKEGYVNRSTCSEVVSHLTTSFLEKTWETD